jgi:hypothetical protein
MTQLRWDGGERELAIHLADASEDYVWHLATMPQNGAQHPEGDDQATR